MEVLEKDRFAKVPKNALGAGGAVADSDEGNCYSEAKEIKEQPRHRRQPMTELVAMSQEEGIANVQHHFASMGSEPPEPGLAPARIA